MPGHGPEYCGAASTSVPPSMSASGGSELVDVEDDDPFSVGNPDAVDWLADVDEADTLGGSDDAVDDALVEDDCASATGSVATSSVPAVEPPQPAIPSPRTASQRIEAPTPRKYGSTRARARERGRSGGYLELRTGDAAG